MPDRERAIYNRLKERYSLHFESLTVGAHTIRLLKASDLEELLEGKDPFADVSAFPFWSRLWESSIVLAHILADSPERHGGRLLELGAGLGAPGLVASAAGYEVVLGDYEEFILDFQRVSAAASNVESVEPTFFDWLNPPDIGTFDVISGAEILFKEEFLDPLLNICKNYLREGGTIYLAHDVKRKCLPLFLERAEYYFHIGTRKQTIQRNGLAVDILVNRLQRKQ